MLSSLTDLYTGLYSYSISRWVTCEQQLDVIEFVHGFMSC